MATITPSTISIGTVSGAFNFGITLSGVSGDATVTAYFDGSGEPFYQLNFAWGETEYPVNVTDNMVESLGGGQHAILLSATDGTGTSTASVAFSKGASLPLVTLASNLGDKASAFAVAYNIKNMNSEHPALVAYMDSESEGNELYSIADASQNPGRSFTVSQDAFNSLNDGSHTVIVTVTNSAGSTTKSAAFTKVTDDGTYTGLKLGYGDDTWDSASYPKRIYTQGNATHSGKSYLTFTDETPYDTKGESVTGGLLAAFSRGVQNAAASNVVRNDDGSFTERSSNGISTISKTDGGIVEVFSDREGNTLTKTTFFNEDGSISESVSYAKSES